MWAICPSINPSNSKLINLLSLELLLTMKSNLIKHMNQKLSNLKFLNFPLLQLINTKVSVQVF